MSINANRAIVPESEKSRARDTAAERVGASPRCGEKAQQIAKDAPAILDHAQGSVGKQSSQHRCGKRVTPLVRKWASLARRRNNRLSVSG